MRLMSSNIETTGYLHDHTFLIGGLTLQKSSEQQHLFGVQHHGTQSYKLDPFHIDDDEAICFCLDGKLQRVCFLTPSVTGPTHAQMLEGCCRNLPSKLIAPAIVMT